MMAPQVHKTAIIKKGIHIGKLSFLVSGNSGVLLVIQEDIQNSTMLSLQSILEIPSQE